MQGTKILIKLVPQVSFVVSTADVFPSLTFAMGIMIAATGLTKANAVSDFKFVSTNPKKINPEYDDIFFSPISFVFFF